MNKISILAFVVVLVGLTLAVTSLWNDSFIVDEIPHVGAGYSYITKGDYRLNPEHPPLAKDVAGLALSLLPISQSAFTTKDWNTDINGQWNFGRSLIYAQGNNVDLITRTAKTVMLVFFVLSVFLIYRWTKERYGKTAALIATILFSFSPTILAHSRFVTTDMAALFGVLFAIYFFIKFLENPNDNKYFWLASIAFGIAQLTKFSAVLLVPLFALMLIGWGFANYSFIKFVRVGFRSILVMAVGIVLVVWPVYFFHTMNYPPYKQKIDTEFNLNSYKIRPLANLVTWSSDKPVIRSLTQYATGVLMVNQRSLGGNTTFFLGEVNNQAWKKYFPVVYGIKEPLPFLLLVVIALIFLSLEVRKISFKLQFLRSWVKTYFVEFSMLLWIFIYWFLSINANLNIGVRHLLPTYGFVFILLAGQLAGIINGIKNYKLRINNKFKKSIIHYSIFIIPLLLSWYVVENIRVYPYYLTYFNQLAGGPSGGYRYVVDSNLDWGQDLKRLAMWVRDKNVEKIYLDYFGWADQNYYLKDQYVWIHAGDYKNIKDFLANNPSGGYIAVSASFYMNSRQNLNTSYAWLDSYKPTAVIGNSIFVWHLTP